MTYQDGGLTVTAWPPAIEPESWAAIGALRSILTSIRGPRGLLRWDTANRYRYSNDCQA